MAIGSIFGIRIVVNATWIFIFALVAWTFGNPSGPLRMDRLTTGERVALGAFASLLFFASVLAHELAHSLVARKRGIPVRSITLFIFGGVSAIEGEPETAPAEAWIAAVGPLTSLIIGLICIGISTPLGRNVPAGEIAFYLGAVNVLLAIFNILPAYPLDGGRVLHAVVWRVKRDRDAATRISVGVGRLFAWGLIGLGVAQTLATGFGGGLWTTFIGWYLLQAGNMEQSRVTIAHALEGHLARELAAPSDVRVPANASIAEAVRYLLTHHVRTVPVFVGDAFAGVVSLDEAAHVAPDERERAYVTSIMRRPDKVPTARAVASAADVAREMAVEHGDAVTLLDDAGEFSGLFTRESAMRWIANAAGSAGSAGLIAPRSREPKEHVP
ncbi:MAG: site-2 protease family protein [Candidatus Eremiobacteraeota bacterium]|nr:site-2 protease family protein [Candidatus Eremiobacteraeota bacterium]MBC5824867.1 site-2 protease family protein [Candidatus Eremiobacteraeota bacterium]